MSNNDPREVAFNKLRDAATQAGVVPTALDWFKAGFHHARASAEQPYCWISRGGGLPQVMFDAPREIQAHAWMPLYTRGVALPDGGQNHGA